VFVGAVLLVLLVLLVLWAKAKVVNAAIVKNFIFVYKIIK
jgi:hypothetical protein